MGANAEDFFRLQYLVRHTPVTPAELLAEIEKNPYDAMQLHQIYLEAFKKDANFFEIIPKSFRNYELCQKYITSVASNENPISFLSALKNYENDTALTDDECKLLCKAMNGSSVRYSSHFIDTIPAKILDFSFCINIVENNDLTKLPTKFFERIMKNENTSLTNDEYKTVYLAALAHDNTEFKLIPKKFLSFDICMQLASEPHIARSLLAYLVPLSECQALTFDQYVRICITALPFDSEALKFVDGKAKGAVIDALTPEKIIANNYKAKSYFPKEAKYESAINQYLSQVTHVIITDERSFRMDREIRDALSVYTHSPSRFGKTVHVGDSGIENILDDVKSAKKEGTTPITLVMLGHCGETHQSVVADLDADNITTLLIKYSNIDRVTLLGCKSAQSLPLKKEEEMAKFYLQELKHVTGTGVILMSKLPEPEQYADFLTKLKFDRDGNTSNSVFIFVKLEKDGVPQYHLINIQRNNAEPENITEERYPLDEEQIKQIGKLIASQTGQLKFPTGNNKSFPLYYRGGKGTSYIDADETEKLLAIVQNLPSKFHKGHPQYKENKGKFPFMTGVDINETELAKLLPSVLKKVVDAIHLKKAEINRDVTVKGYVNLVQVDIPEQRMQATPSKIYVSTYTEKSTLPFFSKNIDNINRKSLEEQQKQSLNAMKDGSSDRSNVKSIRIKIKK